MYQLEYQEVKIDWFNAKMNAAKEVPLIFGDKDE